MKGKPGLDREYTDRYIVPVEARERIAQTALDLFVSRGYDAVGVQEIVARAAVTKPTLYHHFGNKRGLLDALAGRVSALLFRDLEEAVTYRGDMPRDLEALVTVILDFANRHPRETRLLLASQNGPVDSEARQALAPVWRRLSRELETFFRAAARDHGNMHGREGEYTVSLLGTVFAYAVLLLDGRLAPHEGRAHEIMRRFSYGIYT